MTFRGPITAFELVSNSGNKVLYRSMDHELYVSHTNNGGYGTVTIASGGHMIGEYRGGVARTAVEDSVLRKIMHSDLPNEVKCVLNVNAAQLPESGRQAKPLDLTDGPLNG